MTNNQLPKNRPSILHGLLSFILPGLGQFVAGARSRAITIFFSIAILGFLSVWTIAQRARFPEYTLSLNIYIRLVVQAAALLIFLVALHRLLSSFVLRDPALRSFSFYGLVLIFFFSVLFFSDTFLAGAGTPEALKYVYNSTAIWSAATLAALWIWQTGDGATVGGLESGGPLPSMGAALFTICLLIFALGYNITAIDLPKAIREYQDTAIILPRILWPWRQAFAYDQEVVEETQRIEAPCTDESVAPLSNEPDPDNPWISATPTCGEIGIRSLTGDFTPGTLLTITGGNFTPGQTVNILWRNPIGNAFTPRGVGPTDIIIDENGEFTTELNIPSVVIPEDTAVGAQMNTLVVRQAEQEVFSGRLSEEMKLALIGMLETIMIGLMATFFGIILAFPVAFLAARNLMAPVTTPLNQLVGNILGLGAGVWASVLITQRAAQALGGIEQAPIQVFFIVAVSFIILGALGFQLGGRLLAWVLDKLGPAISRVVSAILLAGIAALPGYYLGLGFSRGIRSIVLSVETAAVTESTYAYAGAGLLALAALVFGLLHRGQRGIPVGIVVYSITRTLMNVVRSIEPLIWAIVASIWVGLGPFAGTIALTLHSIAALGKLYSEAIESIDPGPLEALQSTGANRLQTIIYAVIPQILPPFISFTIYRWDINVRLSTIIGLVGGGGIGFILIQWIRLYQYESAGLAVWLIAITVATLDYVSSNIRERYV